MRRRQCSSRLFRGAYERPGPRRGCESLRRPARGGRDRAAGRSLADDAVRTLTEAVGRAGSAPAGSRRRRTAHRAAAGAVAVGDGADPARRGRRRGRGCMRAGGRTTIPPATGCGTGSASTATPSTTGARFAVLPMAFCFPGYDAKGADLPPPPVCAATWRRRALAAMPGGAADAAHRRLCPALAPRAARRHRHGRRPGGTRRRACCRCRIRRGATPAG